MQNYEQLKCCECGKFIKRPYDSSTRFGCADPGAPEPYDPDFYCKPCATKLYKTLLTRYKCCYREGDWQKSDAEIQAAEEAGLEWVHDGGLVRKSTGEEVNYRYIRKSDRQFYVPYSEYHKIRRKENRCKCYRVKDKNGNCPTCSRDEVFCLCKYDSYHSIL